MKQKFLLALSMILISFSSFCTTWTITNSGTTYTQDTVYIDLGDSVKFELASNHDAREVGQSTWESNGNTALSNGFQTAFGGGLVLPEKLTLGTHWYVCTPHASLGMKAVIIVKNTTSLQEDALFDKISLFPNPSKGDLYLKIDDNQIKNGDSFEIINFQGTTIYTSELNNDELKIDLSDQDKGVYLVRIILQEGIITKMVVLD